jgi:hypothetical protein
MKRARISSSDQLTGGTKDVNPQHMSGSITLSAANTGTAATIPLPTVRMATKPNTSVLVELLWLLVDWGNFDLDAAAATDRYFTLSFSTLVPAATPVQVFIDNPRTIAYAEHYVRNAFTAAGTGILDIQNGPTRYDFTDMAGHGPLVATDNMYAIASSAGMTAATKISWRWYYRMKEVSLVEYIGIVQSQS